MVGRGESGILFVLSAPSGTGKSTLARALVRRVPGLEFSVSYTTREPRAGECEGTEYHFVERARFEAMISEGAFLEWAEVFGNLYGTGLGDTRRALATGRDLLLDIDVQGAQRVREGPVEEISVMILPPDFPTLQTRLRGRGSEEEAERERRLAQAREEVEEYRHFDYVVVNEDLDRTVDALAAIVTAERHRGARLAARVREILASFPD